MPLDQIIKKETDAFNRMAHLDAFDPSFIPVHLTGGIGDIIISLDAIRFLSERFQVVVYTHHIEAFKYFYKHPISVFKKLPEYSWALEFNTFAKFHCGSKFSGFLVKEHEALWRQQQDRLRVHPRLETILKSHFNKFILISNFAKEMGESRWSFPLFSLGFDERPEFEFMPRVDPAKYITIHDGFDVHNACLVSGRATKTWKWDSWNALVKSLKRAYPDRLIIQLGSTTSREIDGVDCCMINRTTITEAFQILSKSSLHIDGDSGLTHAATRMQVPVIAMWGPTPHEFYGYPQNINLTSSVCKSACYGVKENWNDKCAIGHSSPKCMDEISVEQVLEAVKEKL